MQYKRRKDGRFYTTIGTGQYDDNGKELRVAVYDRDELAFLEKIQDIKYEIKHGMYTFDRGFTFQEYAKLWLKTYKPDDKGYANIIKNHLYNLKTIPLGKVVKTDIQECVNHNKGHYDLQRRQRMTINLIMDTAMDDGLIKRNPCRKIIIDPKPMSKRRSLTEKEKQIIIKTEMPDMEKLFLMILFYTGMRRGEVLALQKTDFDLIHKTITIDKAVSFDAGEKACVKSTKTINGIRTIDLLSHLEKYIKPYFLKHDDMNLFTDENGNLLTKTRVKKMWDRIYDRLEANGFKERITPHFLRHSFATDLYYAKIDIKKAIAIMGHADSKMLIDVYAHLDEKESKSLDKLESRFDIKSD